MGGDSTVPGEALGRGGSSSRAASEAVPSSGCGCASGERAPVQRPRRRCRRGGPPAAGRGWIPGGGRRELTDGIERGRRGRLRSLPRQPFVFTPLGPCHSGRRIGSGLAGRNGGGFSKPGDTGNVRGTRPQAPRAGARFGFRPAKGVDGDPGPIQGPPAASAPWPVPSPGSALGFFPGRCASLHERVERLIPVERHPDGEDAGVAIRKRFPRGTGGHEFALARPSDLRASAFEPFRPTSRPRAADPRPALDPAAASPDPVRRGRLPSHWRSDPAER